MNQSTCFLHQLGQAIQMPSCPMVMNGYNRVHIALGHRPDGVTYPSLHFRIGTLHRIQLDSVSIYPGIYRRNGTTTHSDAVIITPKKHNLFSGFRSLFHGLFFISKTDTTGLHNYFIVTIRLFMFLMLKREHGTHDKWLSEFISKIRCPVRSLDQNIFRSLV